MPGPNLLPSIVNACRAVMDATDHARLDLAKLEAFAASDWASEASPYVRLPIKFENQEVYIAISYTLIMCLHMLGGHAATSFAGRAQFSHVSQSPRFWQQL